MMESREIWVGNYVRLSFPDGREFYMFIREIKEGKVTFRRSKQGKTGGWWLPIEIVKNFGTLIREASENVRGAVRVG